MPDLKKPKFWNHFSESVAPIISIISCCVSVINFPNEWNFWLKALSIIGVFIGTYVICLLIYNVAYSILLFRYCNKYEKSYKELLKQKNILAKNNNKYTFVIKESQKIIKQYRFNQNSLINEINAGTLPVKDYEKEYLNNLLKSAYKKREYMNSMEEKYERIKSY